MRKAAVLLVSLLASACAVGPDYKRPTSPPPAAGAFQTVVPGTSTAAADDKWWRLYDDPALDALIQRALAANTDLRVARANLERAQAVLREARANLLPQGQTTGSAQYGNSQGGGGNGNFQQGGGASQWSYNGGIDVQWDIDLFGRLRRTVEATRADAQADEAARDRVALTVAAETARAYVDACALAESIEVARQSADIAGRQLTLLQERERAGAAARLDTERSATALANVRAELPSLEGRRRASLFELAALLGATPSEVPQEAQQCRRAPKVLQVIPVGDGQALLARRPDVREAERKLAADTARIGVTTAELYPQISLGGSGNFFRNDQVRGSDSFTFALGPLLSWSFPSMLAGRTRIDQAEATTRASLATFDGTVLTALKEVEQALSYYAAEGERNARLREAAQHADAAYKLADQRFRAGSIGLIDQLDAQRELTTARSALAASDQQLGSLRVDLFKALGGGWADLPPVVAQAKPN
ncbi:efflux transporter outer membrane subunit [Novosphingobium sp. G106]|uniref:efflux transporter outer membrane subunit n=1 Tax=Novosphingobium sp. G106 TaxID=2849500 RepID=UPI001C2DAE61|nr:efflux transporter outer membrane subunit [Novosphingobium sp. G106]MBV1689413.1 efflux transporter outer membrane subunit [Novosphingobium sp. G106]